jgi:hypothetical protein
MVKPNHRSCSNQGGCSNINKIMNVANKTYRNLKTGETIKVIDSLGDIVILDNKNRININDLLDTNKYEEQIDPNSFINNTSAFSSLTEKIKEIPTDNMVDESVKIDRQDGFSPQGNESAVIQSSLEDERAELARKYGVNPDTSSDVNKQKESFDKILNPDNSSKTSPIREDHTNSTSSERTTSVSYENNNTTPTPNRVEVEDPIITMFKNAKRNKEFKINIDINDEIPRYDFIEMMEDSYNVSIIDFLASDITNKILENPESIKKTVREEIEKLVYGEVKKKETEKPKKKTKKPSAKERAKNVEKMNSVEEIEKALEGEKAKTVISAGKTKIRKLLEDWND